MLHGQNLTGAQVRSPNPTIAISDVLVNREGTYLFVNVGIDRKAHSGSYNLIVETTQGRTTASFKLEPELDGKTNFQGISTDDVIYLIMIDRFANGDPSNDTPANSPVTTNDRNNPRAYHGGDLRGIIDRLPYLKELGVTALWLTPWYDNWNGVNNCEQPWCPNTYYHGYHAIDYYSVEDHFGNMETVRELVTKAHTLGIKIIQDQVANHVGSRHPWVTNMPLEGWFHGSISNPTLNKFSNSALLSPHANQEEVRNTLEGWFDVDLPDMNQEHPEVARYEIQNALWWLGMTGVDGIREDTIQYMSRRFIRDLATAIHRQYPRMWMVGEVLERDAAHTAFFMGGHTGWDGLDTQLDSVFDFALCNTARLVFTGKLPVRSLRDILKYDALYPDPTKLTMMVSNHDMMRFMSVPGASIEGAKLQMAFVLSARGTPQLYYGEEIAMEGGDDPDNRRDFPGGFPGDKRNAFMSEGRTPPEQQMYDWTRTWLRLRRDHPAVRHGKMIDLSYDDDTYVFARQDKSETVILAINRSDSQKEVVIPAGSIGIRDGSNLVPVIGHVTGKVADKLAKISIPRATATASVIE
jgi:glycosidase